MNVWRIILATLVIFGAGIVTGTLFVSHSQPQPPPVHTADTAGPMPPPHPWAGGTNQNHEAGRFGALMGVGMPPRGSTKDFLDRLDAELKLTGVQREHIKKILDDGQEHTKDCWKQIEPEVRKEMRDCHDKIRAELTPEQQVKYAELFKPRQPRPRRADEGPNLERRMGASTNAPSAPPGQLQMPNSQ